MRLWFCLIFNFSGHVPYLLKDSDFLAILLYPNGSFSPPSFGRCLVTHPAIFSSKNLIMGDSITAHNNLAFMTNAQVEPIDANISRETLLQTGFTLQQRPTCISCDDKNDANLFAAPCKHGYCDECLASYVKSALEPDGNFPPGCCNLPITLQSARPHLHYDWVKSYEERYAEINAACSLLCARPGCCVVIPQEKIVEGLGHCTACNNYTCTRCRLQKYRDKLCPTDAEQEDLLKLAKEKGWCRCYRCNNMIELNFGCNHMTRILLRMRHDLEELQLSTIPR